MSTPSWEILVVANPVWETAWRVETLPTASFDEASATDRAADGGGSALNTACALAAAGRRVLAIGRVGDDPEGRASVTALDRRGVTAAIVVVAGRTTKRNHLYVERETARTAFEAFLPPLCVPAWEDDPHELLDASVLWLDRLAARAPSWLRQRAGRPGLTNALNRNSPTFRGPSAQRARTVLAHLDLLQIPEGRVGATAPPIHHEPEVRGTIHSPAPMAPLRQDEAQAILDAGVGILVRTRGEDGVIIQARGEDALTIPAVPTPVIDPTGAGDAFAAGLLDGRLDGMSIADAARRGLDWAARACRHLGARAWLDAEPPERS